MDNFQHIFLDQIVSQFNKKSEAVKAIAKVLELGEDAIYKRLRGDSFIYPKEIAILARTFSISVDDIILNL